MVSCLHQNNVYIKRKLQVWRVQKCIPLVSAKTVLTCVGRQITPSHLSQYRAENGNLRKSGSTFRHGTAFAPKQCLYQKEAPGMDSLKILSSSQWKNCTYVCGTENYPISFKPSIGPRIEIWGNPSWCKNRTYLCGTEYYPISSKPSIGPRIKI